MIKNNQELKNALDSMMVTSEEITQYCLSQKYGRNKELEDILHRYGYPLGDAAHLAYELLNKND